MARDTEQKVKDGKSMHERSFSRAWMRLKLRRFAAGVALVAALVVALLVIVHNYRNRSFTYYDVVGEAEWHSTQTATILAYGTDFISYSADGLHCTNAKGADLWSASYLMQNPMVRVRGDYVAAADHKGRTIYVYAKNGPIGEITTNSPIEQIALSAGGVVVAVLDDGSTTPVNVYYYDGKQIAAFRTTMAHSGYPVSVAISENSRLVAISYLRVDSGSLVSSVAFYNFGEVGKNETDNLVSSSDFQGELVSLVDFLDNERAYSLSDSRLTVYDGDQMPRQLASDMLGAEARSVFHGSAHLGIVYYNDSAESRYRMQVYNRKGERVSTVDFDIEYSDIVFHQDRILIYSGTACAIYSVDGQCKYEGAFDEYVRLMLPTSSRSRYTIVTSDAIRSIQLR